MKSNKVIDKFTRGLDSLIHALFWVSAAVSTFMILLICANVFGRYLFKKPLLGSLEIVELSIVIVVFCVVSYTELRRGHVTVDVITEKLPKHVQKILASVMRLISAAFYIVMAWQVGLLMYSRMSPMVKGTDLLVIPFWPFMLVMALGALLLSLKLLSNTIHDLSSLNVDGGEEDQR